MDVRIGLVYSARELEIELADDTDVAALKQQLTDAVGSETAILWLIDKKGNDVAIVADKITYVQIGSGSDKGRIGFG